jgi:Uma2 family endonuclease
MSEAFKIDPVRLEEFEEMSFGDRKVELIDGMIVVAHAFPSPRHGRISAAVATAFNIALRAAKKPCRAEVGTGVTLRLINDNQLGPDVLVTCGGKATEQGAPLVAVEVLSPSNSLAEINRKTTAYRAHPDMRHLLLLRQDEYRAEHWKRGDDGRWHADLLEGADAVLEMPDLAGAWTLAELYGDIY